MSSPTLAAFSAATGRQIRVLHAWARSRHVDCGAVTTDPLGGSLLACTAAAVRQTAHHVTATATPHPGTSLFAVDPATGQVSALPFKLPADGLAW